MVKTNVINLYNNREDLFWRGMTLNIAIIKQCLNYMRRELTSDITDKAINELQDENDKGKYSQRSKKKCF